MIGEELRCRIEFIDALEVLEVSGLLVDQAAFEIVNSHPRGVFVQKCEDS